MATAPASNRSPGSWPLYRALVGVGVVCGLLIVSAYVLTGPVIAPKPLMKISPAAAAGISDPSRKSFV